MTGPRHTLTLAHSGDPDDCFMWWPITGKIDPSGKRWPGEDGKPAIDTGRFSFEPIAGDIEHFNRRAIEHGDYDITALSVRAYTEARHRYALTHCGSSFGEGYGPKVVRHEDNFELSEVEALRSPDVTVAIPGRKTTAFMVLNLLIGKLWMPPPSRFVETPFDKIIPAVAEKHVRAGLVIHEAQVSYEDAGLRQVIDLGSWWKQTRNLPLPLGVNAIRRDLDGRFGDGSEAEVVSLLHRSIEHALKHREQSLNYTLPFAMANARASGTADPDLERIDRYVSMYVTRLTVDMGTAGRDAIRKLLREGHAAGLCPEPGEVDVV
ncbi:MAG: menaquinone biosynthesis family protein [Phycisphaerales bacterium]